MSFFRSSSKIKELKLVINVGFLPKYVLQQGKNTKIINFVNLAGTKQYCLSLKKIRERSQSEKISHAVESDLFYDS